MTDVLRIRRRAVGGAAGPPSSLVAAEIAFNEVDNALYYGKGNSGGLATSIIPIAGPGAFLPLVGGRLSGGLSFGSATVTDPIDMSRHISLYDAWGGFTVTGGGLNVVAGGALQMSFYGSSAQMRTGISLFLDHDPTVGGEAATKQYVDNNTITPAAGDARWVNVTGDTMTGNLGAGTNYGAASVNAAASFANGAYSINLISRAAGGGYSSVVQTNDAFIMASSGGPDGAALTLAPWSNGAVGIRLSAPANSVTLSGGTVSLNGATNLVAADPTALLGIATKQYVDNLITRTGGPWLPLAGGTVTGPTTFSAYAGFSGPNPQVNIVGPVNTWRTLQFYTGAAARWNIQAEASTEPGSNVGSDLLITRWLDNGNPEQIVRFSRSTGNVTFGYGVTAGGLLSVIGPASFSSTVALAADPTTALQAVTKQYVDNNTITPAAGDARWVNVNGDTMTAALQIGTPTGTGTPLLMTGAAGTQRAIQFRSDSRTRWMIECQGVAETGGGVGGDFLIDRYDDSGTYVGTPFLISRATGGLTLGASSFSNMSFFNAGLTVSGGDFSLGSIYTDGNWGFLIRGRSGAIADVALADSGGNIPLRIKNSTVLLATTQLDFDPTTAMQAVTKQYSDRNKQLNYVDVTSNAASPTVATVDYGLIYIYGSPTGPATITMPVATTTRILWTPYNVTGQPVTLRGVSGGTVTLAPSASQAVWSDGAGIYPLYNAGATRAPGDSSTFWATTAFVQSTAGNYLPLVGGTLSGPLTVNSNLTVNGILSAAGWLRAGLNTNVLPPSDGALYVGWNRSQGGGEVNFFNSFNAPGVSFAFDQVVSTGNSRRLMNIMSDASLSVPGNIRFEGNAAAISDLSKHIALNSTTGFNVWGTQLNSVVATGGAFNWTIGSTSVGYLDSTGLNYLPIGQTGAAAGKFSSLMNTGSFALNNGIGIAYDGNNYIKFEWAGVVKVHVDGNNYVANLATQDWVSAYYLPLTGGTLSNGLHFGSATTPSGNAWDTSRHITLFDNGYGFSITGGTLNIVSGIAINMISGNTTVASFGSGLNMSGGYTVTLGRDPTAAMETTTKQYVDARGVRVLATIAALRAATSTTLATSQCFVQSYAGTTNKGGGNFLYVSTDTTTADNGGTVIVDASSRRWYREGWLDNSCNVQWFGATGDGTTNDAPAIQAAIATGRPVYMPRPASSYRVLGPINCTTQGQIIAGDGKGVTILTIDSSFTPLTALGVFVCPSGPWVPGPQFRDFQMNFVQPDTTVYANLVAYPTAFYAQAVARGTWHGIKINAAKTGIDLRLNAAGTTVADCELCCFDWHINMDGEADSMTVSNVRFEPDLLTANQSTIYFTSSTGIIVGRCDDLHVLGCLFYCRIGINAQLGADGINSVFGNITNCDFDTYAGLNVQAASNLEVSGCAFTLGTANSYALEMSNGNLSMTGCWVYTTSTPALVGAPILITGASHLQISALRMDINQNMVAVNIFGTAVTILSGCQFNVAVAARTQPVVAVNDSAILTMNGCRYSAMGAGSGQGLNMTGQTVHNITGNCFNGWALNYAGVGNPSIIVANNN